VARGNGGGADSPLWLNGGAFVLGAMGAMGAAGWFWGVADYVMFYAAMAIFAAYLVFCAWALRVIAARVPTP